MARILIIEDSPLNLELLNFVLSTTGHDLLQADRAPRGIEIARQASVDLILMDINMPGMDGVEAVRTLRAHPETRGIPIVAVTALAMAGDKERIIAAGFDDYIAKPVDFALLLEKVAQFTQTKF